jgi:hypothetical protein
MELVSCWSYVLLVVGLDANQSIAVLPLLVVG